MICMSRQLLTILEAPVDEADHVRGPRRAEVTLVEYGDFECHFCQKAHGVLRQLQDRFPDTVRLVFRHTPRSHAHPNAHRAAQASEAAAAQGKFWEMHDRLFDHPQALTETDLIEHARAIGLDVERFTEELRGRRHAARVDAQEAAAVHTVITTPTLFLDGMRFDDGLDLDTLELAVGEALRLRRGEGRSVRSMTDAGAFRQRVSMGPHELTGDRPAPAGGTDAGPDPHDLLGAALATCTAMTIQEAARRRGWPLNEARVDVTQAHAGGVLTMRRTIALVGDLTQTQREALHRIAGRSPITTALARGAKIETELLD
jgi:protein-disulfide isomerase/uncharacterized OsmC-like protein